MNIDVTRPAVLMISFSGSIFTRLEANTASNVLLTLSLDGVDRTDLFTMDHRASSGQAGMPGAVSTPAGFSVVVPVEPGTHSAKLRMQLSGNWGVVSPAIGIGSDGRQSTFSVLSFDRSRS